MYHIKSDARSQKSAQAIYSALRKLLESKSFADITISDIQKTSSVSRATFYRHFDNTADVLTWQSDCYFARMFQSYISSHPHPAQGYEFVQYLLTYWTNNSEILEILLHINRTDIIYESHLKNFRTFIAPISPAHLNGAHYEYAMGLRSGLMIGVLSVWLSNHKKQSAEELFAIIKNELELWRKNDFVI